MARTLRKRRTGTIVGHGQARDGRFEPSGDPYLIVRIEDGPDAGREVRVRFDEDAQKIAATATIRAGRSIGETRTAYLERDGV